MDEVYGELVRLRFYVNVLDYELKEVRDKLNAPMFGPGIEDVEE